MLANVDKRLLLTFMIIGFVIALGIIIGVFIWSTIKIKKGKSDKFKKIIILTFGSIIIAAASWVFNFGWIRFFMTFLLVPVIHTIIFFLTNILLAMYTDRSSKMLKLNLWFVITYLSTYLFLPDGGDYGGMYFFFGLIHNNNLAYAASFIAEISAVVHVVLFVLQIVEVIKIKKSILNSNEILDADSIQS